MGRDTLRCVFDATHSGACPGASIFGRSARRPGLQPCTVRKPFSRWAALDGSLGQGAPNRFARVNPKWRKYTQNISQTKYFPRHDRPRHSLDSQPSTPRQPRVLPVYRTWDIYRNSKRAKFYTTGGCRGGRPRDFSSVSSRSLGRRVCSSRGVKERLSGNGGIPIVQAISRSAGGRRPRVAYASLLQQVMNVLSF